MFSCSARLFRDRSLFIAGGKDLGLNKVKFSRSPPLNVTSLKCSPRITFDDFRDSPPPPTPHPMSSFSKQIWVVPPLNPYQVLSDPTLLGSQLRLISLFVVLKIKWSPQNPPRPHPQTINNDRSLNSWHLIFPLFPRYELSLLFPSH